MDQNVQTGRIVNLNQKHLKGLISLLPYHEESPVQVFVTDAHVEAAAKQCDTYERLQCDALNELRKLRIAQKDAKAAGLSTRALAGQIKTVESSLAHWEVASAAAGALWLALEPHNRAGV